VIFPFHKFVDEVSYFSLVHVYLLVVEDVSELLDGSVMTNELRHSVVLFRRDHEDVRTEVVFLPFPVAVGEDDDAVVVHVVGLEIFSDAVRIRTATTRSRDLLEILFELLRLDHLRVPESEIDFGLLVEVVQNFAALADVGLGHRVARVDGEEHLRLAVGAVARKIFVALVDTETSRDALAAADSSAEASDDESDVDLALVLEHDLFHSFAAQLAPARNLALILDHVSDHLVYDIVCAPLFSVLVAVLVPFVEGFFFRVLLF